MNYFFWFWFTVARKAQHILRTRKAETRKAYLFLKNIEKQFDGVFDPATRRKIAVSHGIYCPMICDAFTGLHGRLTNDQERERFIHYFICSSLFDDFTDYGLITQDQLEAISFQAETYEPQSFEERVFLHSHRLLRDFVKDKEGYDDVSKKLFDAQVQSKKQVESTLNPEGIASITFRKGGNAVLLCRYYLDINAGDAEDQCWYKTGVLIQLINDLYDIHKDLQDHITTLPGCMDDAVEFGRFFRGQVNEMKMRISRLPFSARRRQDFSLSLAGIYAFGLIAVGRLEKMQKKSGRLPPLKTLSRKELIVDMEKPGNLVRWFRFTYRHGRLAENAG